VQIDINLPKITITINKNSVMVVDNARGIEAKILTRIFEPYFSTKEGNSGIGLYNVQDDSGEEYRWSFEG